MTITSWFMSPAHSTTASICCVCKKRISPGEKSVTSDEVTDKRHHKEVHMHSGKCYKAYCESVNRVRRKAKLKQARG